MEASDKNKDKIRQLISFHLGFLRNFPEEQHLDGYIVQVLDIVTDMSKADKVLHSAGGRFKWFPSPREIRELWCKEFGAPASGPDTMLEE